MSGIYTGKTNKQIPNFRSNFEEKKLQEKNTDWSIDIILFNKKRRETVLRVGSHLGLVNLRVRTYHNDQTYYT
jgi:hypothetical protein